MARDFVPLRPRAVLGLDVPHKYTQQAHNFGSFKFLKRGLNRDHVHILISAQKPLNHTQDWMEAR